MALALAGALALQRTIITLQGVGGLLRTVSTPAASTPVRGSPPERFLYLCFAAGDDCGSCRLCSMHNRAPKLLHHTAQLYQSAWK